MIEQRTSEWYEVRRGRFTASDIHRLMGIKGLNKNGETYILEKVAEKLGATMPDITTYAMQLGIEREPFAKRFYSKAFKCAISEQPFIVAEWSDDAGCSPDGLVVEFDENDVPKELYKGIEIKCPNNPIHHIENMRIKSAEQFKEQSPEYYWQVQMCMAVTGLKCWDYVSYYHDISPDFRMFAIEIPANEKDIELLKTRISMAVERRNEILKELSL